MPQRLSVVILLLAVGSWVGADVLTRTDGVRVEGDVKREGENWVVTGADGLRTIVKPGEVKSIELTGKPGAQSESALASLRRSSEAQSDPARVIERYKQFIEMNRGTPAEDPARDDLAVWQDRQDKGMVKIGPRWLEKAEADRLRLGATDIARAAILALRESRLNVAEESIQAALEADPGNPTALYLRGVLSYRQDKFADARKAFEAVLAGAPNHGPTLGNLAVTTVRMNQWGVALNAYDAALVAMPLERGLLNNVAEFLNLMPAGQKNLALAKRVERKFQEQDAVLAQRLAQQGLFRWGATWVNQQQLDELRAAERKVQDDLDKLAGLYEQLAQRLNSIDSQIRINDQDLRRIETGSFAQDAQGNIIRVPLPSSYYTIQQQNDRLKLERRQVEFQQGQARDRAREVRKMTPIPKYTGIQQLYSAEAAPMLGPANAASVNGAPATQPELR